MNINIIPLRMSESAYDFLYDECRMLSFLSKFYMEEAISCVRFEAVEVGLLV